MVNNSINNDHHHHHHHHHLSGHQHQIPLIALNHPIVNTLTAGNHHLASGLLGQASGLVSAPVHLAATAAAALNAATTNQHAQLSEQQNLLVAELIQSQQRQQIELFLRELVAQHQILKLQQELNNKTLSPHLSSPPQQIPIVGSLSPSVLNSMPSGNEQTMENELTSRNVTPDLANLEIWYSNASPKNNSKQPVCSTEAIKANQTSLKASYTVNKPKMAFGRRVANISKVTGKEELSESGEDDTLEIFIENSTLVSRRHFLIECVDEIIAKSDCEDEADLTEDVELLKRHMDSARSVKYWKLSCVSKNGVFVNSRYIQAGKWVRLLGKSYTFRFPNTSIRVLFESLLDAESSAVFQV